MTRHEAHAIYKRHNPHTSWGWCWRWVTSRRNARATHADYLTRAGELRRGAMGSPPQWKPEPCKERSRRYTRAATHCRRAFGDWRPLP